MQFQTKIFFPLPMIQTNISFDEILGLCDPFQNHKFHFLHWASHKDLLGHYLDLIILEQKDLHYQDISNVCFSEKSHIITFGTINTKSTFTYQFTNCPPFNVLYPCFVILFSPQKFSVYFVNLVCSLVRKLEN